MKRLKNDLTLKSILEMEPKDILEYFKSKGIAINVGSIELARLNAFTIAGVFKEDILEIFKKEIETAIEKGITLTTFKRTINSRLIKRGLIGDKLAGWHTDLVFRQNIQNSYMHGRKKQQEENSDFRPYWKYNGVVDKNTRKNHKRIIDWFQTNVVESTNPIWKTIYPPNGFNCRCNVDAYNLEEVEAAGWAIQKQTPKFQIDKGFKGAP
jgi:hypothetical protein